MLSFKILVDNKIFHRDIKLENYLVSKDKNGKIIIKVADFGIMYIYFNL